MKKGLLIAFVLLLTACSANRQTGSSEELPGPVVDVAIFEEEKLEETEETISYIIIKNEKYSTELKELDLSDLSLTDLDIEPLRHMNNLEKLNLYTNKISDITPLEDLLNLRELNLTVNEIENISGLKNLSNLEILSLNSNKIIDISVLEYLPNLRELSIGWNKINDVDTLKKLSKLEYLLVHATSLNDEQVAEIRLALPNCIVSHHFEGLDNTQKTEHGNEEEQ
ncbi:MAG: leucine-rich repeat domain-containing protein [Oscillospiraceae bacterium]|nr:leucine-rich repeat domain-containing protein [Oscillospiraceae bacterium]